ncbi:anaphase-promoting complex subunit Apc3 [Schizosaccharomyces japonicus yFS275]|uniref:Anaphase-promoting complex subunit Apc3 n=1 Tax=Schizosaccharomyces japonicus (strain yFS275 / FY16936) TaxID=402676 RepID=B6JZC7_SCHJY|nr:anaphase-promoting complex subunit Apc3 [Schizosaccharomyces japonicus yFS275]EEB06895.1 anaphase-promoting complex subunit Apc3 [Schizosaccharomyces japonicus yFS275]
MSERLRSIIWYSIDIQDYKNAIFFAERLYTMEGSLDNLCLLAHTHLLQLNYAMTFQLLEKHAINPISCYTFAKACLYLGKYKQGISALEMTQESWRRLPPQLGDSTVRRTRPDAGSMFELLGHLYMKSGIVKKAAECFAEALSANPYLFTAFQSLVAIGVHISVEEIFTNMPAFSIQEYSPSETTTPTPLFGKVPSAANTPTNPTSSYVPNIFAVGKGFEYLQTPQNNSLNTDPSNKFSTPVPSFSAALKQTPLSRAGTNVTPNDASRFDTGTRKTPALFQDLRKTVIPPRPVSTATLTAPASSTSAAVVTSKKAIRSEQAARPTDEEYIITILKLIAQGCYALAQYDLPEALKCFQALPLAEQNSSFILAKLGLVYFELVQYDKAVFYFEKLRRGYPARIEDMEVYSTALWHLQKKVELSYLAHEALELHPYAPQSWCILANCFSLQREHSQALKCITRAIQLDSTFEYAYTLQGHEYSANEEYEKAKTSFRRAIRINIRHYNAWYGIGMVYLKTGRNDQADFHFKKAAEINPHNSVLMTCIGMIYERMKKFTYALEYYRRACVLDEKSSLARFKKAKVLVSLREYSKALEELEALKVLAPDEANVHFLLGKLYKRMKKRSLAMRHLTIAWNLDGKANHIIKESIEHLDVPEENLLGETGEIYKNLDE